MTSAEATRPVLIALALALTGCGAVEGDPQRFQTAADRIAAIDIPLDPRAAAAPPRRASAEEQGLRPARFSPVKVELMTPYEMWDARDAIAGLQPVAAATGPGDLREAAPAVVRTVQRAVLSADAVADGPPKLRPAVVRAEAAKGGRLIQLGAYSTEAAAREAWNRLKTQAALSGLSPRFEDVEVGGRRLTRLKVGPIQTEAAAALCAAAQVADPWCRRAG